MNNTKIISGKFVSEKKYENLTKRIKLLKDKNVVPHLVVIQLGDDSASSLYIKNKENTCNKLGIKSTIIKLAIDTSFDELKKIIIANNNDDGVDAILVQFPLPKNIDEADVINLIAPHKDADGLNPINQGYNFTKSKVFAPKPCTPNGIIEMFKTYEISLSGQTAAIIGRSNIVGKPLYNLMVNENAVVTTLHTRTKEVDFKRYIKNADIIVMAAGVKDLINPDMVKDGVVIIDVGIHHENGKLRGDVSTKEFIGKASWITPVPGGVGPMTVTMLMDNVVSLTEKYRKEI